MNVTLQDSAVATVGAFAIDFSEAATGGLRIERPRHIPLSIPAAQLYYWSRTWQEGEARALEDLNAGRSRVFNDPRELARYLLRPDE